MGEAKKCPVDRGKLLIGLECCRRFDKCRRCPYGDNGVACSGKSLAEDALAYIGYLEVRLEEAGSE